ncbi:MAG: type IV toxin-antitoxin system AbiEi family antitoxin domain-containing protein [Candidatus Thermoplasmatota archaeon]|nr:type IV toxin-antitoxin system AbiEi family antitoxin domain-containing protein [Candidatus Thermoplasmatota archaeon]
MRITLLDELSKKKAFTIEDAEQLGYTNKSVLKVILSRLEKKGWIERIEKGKYIVIPLGAEKGKYTLNEFVLGSYLVDPCIISYWSALNYYGFTEQIPRTVFIQTTSRKKHQEITIFGVPYKIIRMKKEKIFGVEKAWFEETQINLTNREKTIIDCLDKPQHAGGIIEVAKALRTKEYDKNILVKYAKRINNSGVIRRLGYICDFLQISINLPEIKTRNYLKLDPILPETNELDSKWNLIINEKLGDLE